MGAGRQAFAAAAVALLPLLAGAAYPDCFDSCYNVCVSTDKFMRYYCSYACDRTCTPEDSRVNSPPPPPGPRPPVRNEDPFMNCHLVCAREFCLPRGADGEDGEMCSELCFSSCSPRTPRAFRPAALPPHHPFHKQQRAIRQVVALPDHPFRKAERPIHRKQGAAAARPAAALIDHPFHEKQDAAVKPTAKPDPDDVAGQAWVLPY